LAPALAGDGDYGTTSLTSFDGALVPIEFFALIRMK
jgi:hypothetical protein